MYINSSRKSILIGLLFLVASTFTQAQVGVGANNPNPSAQLEISSTSKGLLPPRMTITQRNAIISPATGLIIFNTTNNALNIYFSGAWYQLSNSVVPGSIATLVTASPTNNGTLKSGTAASGVSSIVSYTGGNGENHSGQTVSSTGVTGLTATLPAGIFALGEGTLTYNITGTPASDGTASFALNIGGRTGTLTRTVTAPPPFVCGTSTVTFTYNGNLVTYGTVVGANSSCWLDRNLGATRVATDLRDASGYGDLFQWGRLADGHQLRTSTNTSTLSSTDVPGNSNYILPSSAPYDWRNPQNNNLWQGVNGTNNVCPTGFRLPTSAEFEAERNAFPGGSNGPGGYASPLKLTLAGFHFFVNQNIGDEGIQGQYWTSSLTPENNAKYFFITNGQAGEGNWPRAVAASVRCIRN
jgi:uncharacterized protein (TIGR02145 family)